LPAFQELVREVFGLLPVRALASEPDKGADLSKMDAAEVEYYLKALQQLLAEKQPYLDPSLSLKSLAGMLSLHPNRLSWLLNEHVGKNFNEFVNGFRLEAFQQLALDPVNDHLTILGLAYESGFNSKTVFNAFFKKIMGQTPSAWLNASRSAS
jgi:AraC-like DNA-binding protein